MIELSADMAGFIAERHLAVLATQRADGSPHAVPVGFTFSDGRVRVITFAPSVKARNARRGGRASVTQTDGGRWVTFEGPVRLLDDATTVASAVAAYARRYRQPGARDDRVVIEIEVDRVMCSSGLK
ncbi:MAG TPA: PPOX class F420-dependent oxidoreductase [Ilumatobacteraceae bacterium]|nr:PPOX class F420-dependent oxidoreductase [Ilumatobacteraceae bacterium]HRB02152.1 PPOX class F420-dependent oxidoreductase [Ilumatobacteraceae bacterium]